MFKKKIANETDVGSDHSANCALTIAQFVFGL